MPGQELNIVEDWFIQRGTVATYSFRLIPLDGNSIASATLVSALGTFTFSVVPTSIGGTPATDFTITKTGTVTNGYTVGNYPYQIFLTFTNGDVWPGGKGTISVS